jgi:hypothetical protein
MDFFRSLFFGGEAAPAPEDDAAAAALEDDAAAAPPEDDAAAAPPEDDAAAAAPEDDAAAAALDAAAATPEDDAAAASLSLSSENKEEDDYYEEEEEEEEEDKEEDKEEDDYDDDEVEEEEDKEIYKFNGVLYDDYTKYVQAKRQHNHNVLVSKFGVLDAKASIGLKATSRGTKRSLLKVAGGRTKEPLQKRRSPRRLQDRTTAVSTAAVAASTAAATAAVATATSATTTSSQYDININPYGGYMSVVFSPDGGIRWVQGECQNVTQHPTAVPDSSTNIPSPRYGSLNYAMSMANDRRRSGVMPFIDLSGVPPQPPIPKSPGRVKEGASKYTGVYWNKTEKKWVANIMIERKKHHIGYYDKEEEAAVDYARAKSKYRGEKFVIDLSGVPPQQPILKSRGRKKGTSKYTGVHWNKTEKKWVANIMIERKKHHIGYYDKEEEAAVDYARAVFKYRGEASKGGSS